MKIFDSEKLIPNHEHLFNVISSHPFDNFLASHISRINIVLSERNGIAQENIETDLEKGEVSLGVGKSTHLKRDYNSILYHEFGHVADRLCVDFQYSDALKSELMQSEKICLMELWNIYINSRLNAVGLYTTPGIKCIGTLNGKREIFPGTIDGDLKVHIATLEREGIPFKLAKEIIEGIWKGPNKRLTYPSMVSDIKTYLANRVAGGFSPPAPTPPGMRVRTGRFTKLPSRSRVVNPTPQFLD